MVDTNRRRTKARFRRRLGRCGAGSVNDELANALDRVSAGMTAEFANSVGRSSAGSECHVKTSLCLKAGCLERITQIVGNTRLRAHPAI